MYDNWQGLFSLFFSSSKSSLQLASQWLTFSKTMSALIGTNASLQAEVISDEILMATYFEVGLSLLTMLANIVNLFCLRKWFVSSVVYQIQQIDSLVTAVCQIGYIGFLLSSISDAPNTYICNAASCLIAISVLHFFLSNLFMVFGR